MCVITLLYHKIVRSDNDADADPLRLSVSLERFQKQIQYLAETGNIISATELPAVARSGRGAQRYYVVTFDDGYRETYKLASTVLAHGNHPATFFVSASHISDTREYWWDLLARAINLGADASRRQPLLELNRVLIRKRYEDAYASVLSSVFASDVSPQGRANTDLLTWDDVLGCDRRLFTIGYHGNRHDCLSALSLDELDLEFQRGLQLWNEHSVRCSRLIAYPYGFPGSVSTDQMREVVSKYCHLGFTSQPGVVKDLDSMDPLQLPRVYVENWPSVTFGSKIDALVNG